MVDPQPLPLNLRFLLWREGVKADQWPDVMANWAKCTRARAMTLLVSGAIQPGEIESVAAATHRSEEDILHANFLAEVDMLRENLRFLIDSLPHGGQQELAAALNVAATTVSKWGAGAQMPGKVKMLAIQRHFQVSPELMLDSYPLFLQLEPVGVYAKRKWLHGQIERLGADTLRELFPALQKLLSTP